MQLRKVYTQKCRSRKRGAFLRVKNVAREGILKRMKNDERHWKILRSDYLFEEPWLTVRRDCVRLPTGAEIPDFYVLEYPTWVNTVAVTREGKFIFVKQYRHGIRETCYEICAGVCENGENPLAAAQRELLEETGYGNGKWSLLTTVAANPGAMTNFTHCFLALDVEKIAMPHLDRTEDLSVHFLTREEVRGLLERDEIKQALMAAPLWKYFAQSGFDA